MSSMAASSNKTMLNYFTKLSSKSCVVEDARKSAPAYNKQHVENFQKDQFDAELYKLNDPPRPDNYIASIRSGEYTPFRVARRIRGPIRARLFQYCEDVRPAYFGTWQKKSSRVTGRRPWGKDESVFDYEVDSEAEWDIGGPGESLKGDDSEDDEELDDYEIDMKTFVPHGYVSEDEIDDNEENGSASADQNIEEEIICDTEGNSNSSVKIIGEKRVKLTTISNSNNHGNKKLISNTVNSPQQQTTLPQVKQLKEDIKPIILGIQYENQQPAVISESKLHFLKGFQGFICN